MKSKEKINPKVPLTLRIGITGHRPHKLKGTDDEELKKIAGTALVDIKTILDDLLKSDTAQCIYDVTSPAVIRLSSALAEGADRIIVNSALDLKSNQDYKNKSFSSPDFNFELTSVLPFFKEEYERKFYPGQSFSNPKEGSIEEFDKLLKVADYKTNQSKVIEFDGSRQDSPKSYQRSGYFMVDHSDIIIAIWNGQQEYSNEKKQCRTGGTSDIIHYALKNSTPVICINIADPKRPTLQFYQTLVNTEFSETDSTIDYSFKTISNFIQKELLFTDIFGEGVENNIRVSIEDSLKTYFKENVLECNEQYDYQNSGPFSEKRTQPLGIRSFFSAFKRFIANPKAVVKEQRLLFSTNTSSTSKSMPALPTNNSWNETQNKSTKLFYKTYLRADRCANYCADTNRSIFLAIYLLGAFALSLAAIGINFSQTQIPSSVVRPFLFTFALTAPLLTLYLTVRLIKANFWQRWRKKGLLIIFGLVSTILVSSTLTFFLIHNMTDYTTDTIYFCAGFELAALLTIAFLWYLDHRFQYHDRWIEYRCLAEFMRPLTYLSLLGWIYSLKIFRNSERELARDKLGYGGTQRSWIYIYSETIVRYAGLPAMKVTKDYLEQCKIFAGEVWIRDQINYHRKNAASMTVLSHRLHKISTYAFIATILVVASKLTDHYHLIFHWEHYSKYYAASLLAILLPVWAAAAFAIRNHAEFQISAQRSSNMCIRLEKQYQRLQKAEPNPTILSKILRETAEITVNEASGWVEIFEMKQSETA